MLINLVLRLLPSSAPDFSQTDIRVPNGTLGPLPSIDLIGDLAASHARIGEHLGANEESSLHHHQTAALDALDRDSFVLTGPSLACVGR
jgi:hypothetical protein